MERLEAEVLSLKEALASREKELVEVKNFRLTKVDSFIDQVANLQTSADALKNVKEEACKATEDKSAEMEQMKESHASTLSQLGETHVAEVSKLREDHAGEVVKLREDHATKILGLQERHDSALVDERTHGYNEAMEEAASDVGALKDHIYRGGYEFDLENAGIPRDHELFGKIVLCPPGAFSVSSSSLPAI